MSIEPYPYERYEDQTSHAGSGYARVATEMEAEYGIPTPISGDATTLRGKR